MIPIPSFRTSRLVFRAIESPLDDEFLVDLFGSDEAGQFGWTDEPVVPWSKKHVEDFHKAIEKAALPVMICLPEEEGDKKKAGRAIGCEILHKIHPIHRSANFGIAVHRDSQGKGYAKEALEWLLERAFIGFGCNRVQGDTWAWHEKALHTYLSIGFVEEGRRRELVWSQGEFRDGVMISMLASDWRARQAKKKPESP